MTSIKLRPEDHEVEEWSAPGQDLALPMVTHQPDVKKRSRIRDELFQGLMKVCSGAGMAMRASEAALQGLLTSAAPKAPAIL